MSIMTEYEIIDFILINFVEPGDLINYLDADYLVKTIDANKEGWSLKAMDRYEDEVDLFMPDDTIVGLLTEG